MLIEILYRSQVAFSWILAKPVVVSGQPGLNLSPWPSIGFYNYPRCFLSFFFLLQPSSPLSCFAYFNLRSPSPLSFPVAGNSHNCWPELPFVAGGSEVWLGWSWMLSSGGSLSATSKQRLLLLTSKTLLHTWQTGGQESEYSYHSV